MNRPFSLRPKTGRIRVSFVALSLIVLAQTIGYVRAQLPAFEAALGNLEFRKGRSNVLAPDIPITVARVTLPSTYFRGVGGVAFGETAVGVNDTIILGLRYDPKSPDGGRGKATFEVPDPIDRNRRKTIEVSLGLADWYLIPIAKFANSKTDACVSRFRSPDATAKMTDEELLEAFMSELEGFEPLRFHPDLENTALGWRLFMGDILITHEAACDLPTINGKLLTPKKPEFAQNRSRFREFKTFNASLDQKYRAKYRSGRVPGAFDSYVITDPIGRIEYWVNNSGKLFITGKPYWFCIQYNSSDDGKVISMPDYSRELTDKIEQLNGINPAVYASLRITMRYAALFRAAKARDPSRYLAFLRSLPQSKYTPTPTEFAVK